MQKREFEVSYPITVPKNAFLEAPPGNVSSRRFWRVMVVGCSWIRVFRVALSAAPPTCTWFSAGRGSTLMAIEQLLLVCICLHEPPNDSQEHTGLIAVVDCQTGASSLASEELHLKNSRTTLR